MKIKRIGLVLLGLVLFIIVGSVIAGSVLTAPVPQTIGEPPADLHVRSVTFQSESGSNIHGWFVHGVKGAGAVALMHGFRSNRLSLVDRARFLNRAGYAVLLFDFQAHGESPGDHVSIGFRESKDAKAAVNFLREQAPGEKVGIVGISMGGASTLLADPPIQAEAIVLEMVYPTIEEAVANRLTRRLGGWSKVLAPLLVWQLKPRLGVAANQLRPIDHLGSSTPKLFIAGADDRHTTLAESQRMFDAAAGPKEFWIVNGAAHVDLHAAHKVEYEQRVISFFQHYLK
jgi:uncharacterized protein